MKKFIHFFFVLFSTSASYSQQFSWAKQFGGKGTDYSQFVCSDADGNIYTMGSFDDTADFDPGPNIFQLVPLTDEDIFIVKTDVSGDFIWAINIGAGNNSFYDNKALACDAQSNIIFSGIFKNTVDFDPGPGTYNLTAPVGTFVCKLDSSGNFVWVKQFDWFVSIESMTFDGNDNLFCCGSISGNSDVDPDSGVFMINTGAEDILSLKLSPSGSFLWAATCPGTTTASGYEIELDAQSNIYISGFFYDTVDFDPGPGTFIMMTGGIQIGEGNDFVLKLSPAGTFIWCSRITTFGATTHSLIIAMALDNQGNIILGGYIHTSGWPVIFGSIQLNSNGSFDMFVAKLNSLGSFVWAKNFGAADEDNVIDLATDMLGNIFVAGKFKDTVDFDPGPGSYLLSCSGYICYCILSLDPSGNFLWTQQNPGAAAICCDVNNQVIIAGRFSGTSNFDAQGTYTLTAFSALHSDAFLMKLANTTGLSSTGDADRINLYPNPAFNKFTIDSHSFSIHSLEILDITGKKIYSDNLSTSNHTTDISVANWNPGIYFVKVQTEKGSIVKKLIVQ